MRSHSTEAQLKSPETSKFSTESPNGHRPIKTTTLRCEHMEKREYVGRWLHMKTQIT